MQAFEIAGYGEPLKQEKLDSLRRGLDDIVYRADNPIQYFMYLAAARVRWDRLLATVEQLQAELAEVRRAEPQARQYGPCTKCGGTDLYIRYHDGKFHCADCKKNRNTPDSCDDSEKVCTKWYNNEHILVHCRRCQWEWVEEVSNATQPG